MGKRLFRAQIAGAEIPHRPGARGELSDDSGTSKPGGVCFGFKETDLEPKENRHCREKHHSHSPAKRGPESVIAAIRFAGFRRRKEVFSRGKRAGFRGK